MFFDTLDHAPERPAFITITADANKSLKHIGHSYADLSLAVQDARQKLTEVFPPTDNKSRYLVALKMHTDYASIVQYLALLSARIAVLLIDPQCSADKLTALQKRFQPNAWVEHAQIDKIHLEPTPIDEQVALLLPTSGSTGAAKTVVLSYVNLHSNAESICDFLPITATDRAMNTLPLFYSYGLSVLNTHLMRGACLVLSDFSVVNREFWQIMREFNISSFAGVPHTYEMLHRLRFDRQQLPDLRYFTQAGGKLSPQLITYFANYAQAHSKLFFIMYGQTEATARMAYLTPEKLQRKPECIGQAIPYGEFKLDTGELCYRGPNVMLGYSQDRVDLEHFSPADWLYTGDLAEVDEEGDYRIIGRKARFLKLNGVRTDLDAIEHNLRELGMRALCCGDDQCLLIGVETDVEHEPATVAATIKHHLHQEMKVHPTLARVITLSSLPITANGKPDYQAIVQAFEQSTKRV